MKAIDGYDDYLVNRKGEVFSYKHFTLRKMARLSLPTGYLYVGLYNEGYRENHYIHRLVAEAFIPNPENKPQINHKDGDKTNNNISNLEWCDASENTLHSYNVLKRKKAWLGKFGKSHGKSKCVKQLDINGKFIKKFDSVTLACIELNVHSSHVCAVANKKKGHYTCGGFKWEWC